MQRENAALCFLLMSWIPHLVSNFFVVQFMVGFADPCTMPQNPGWPLRNLIALLAYHWLVQCYIIVSLILDFSLTLSLPWEKASFCKTVNTCIDPKTTRFLLFERYFLLDTNDKSYFKATIWIEKMLNPAHSRGIWTLSFGCYVTIIWRIICLDW